jgi:hypothetical protein
MRRHPKHSGMSFGSILAKGLAGLGVEFDPKRWRIRCRAHTIKFSLDAFLFARKALDT